MVSDVVICFPCCFVMRSMEDKQRGVAGVAFLEMRSCSHWRCFLSGTRIDYLPGRTSWNSLRGGAGYGEGEPQSDEDQEAQHLMRACKEDKESP